jgi:hypothetical protein
LWCQPSPADAVGIEASVTVTAVAKRRMDLPSILMVLSLEANLEKKRSLRFRSLDGAKNGGGMLNAA